MVGDGVERNLQEAIKWYTKAAEQGNGSAQDDLGVFYLQGNGVQADKIEAYMWFGLAASHNNPNQEHAKYAQGTLSLQLSRQQIAEGDEKIRAWLKKHHVSQD